MKQLLYFILLVITIEVGSAQQLPLSNLYNGESNIGNPGLVNRNFLKYDMAFSADLSYHHQWLGLELSLIHI